ncbi:MAG: hypothetical protein R3240_02470 [Gammaproteobacteria bacterium]|nr:hypothetical protein [Gammaproteobacteria bacterium]
MRKFFYLVILLLGSQTALAKSPSYTFEATGGLFFPSDKNWADYYGNDRMLEASMSFSRRLFYVLDLGMSFNYGKDRGTAVLKSSGTKTGNVTYQILPVDLFAVFRARFGENQWVVPYAGIGYTRFNYRQEIEGETDTQGAVNGRIYRAGLQILLDPLERGAAHDMYANYGVINSYLLLEAKHTSATVDSTGASLGGRSYRIGFLLEY